MAIQLGSAYGKVGLDVKGLLNGVKQGKVGLLALDQAAEDLGAGMKRIGGMLTVGLTLPIVAMGAASIKAASDFEETKNKAVVVFGEMADGVVSNANRAATALGISKTQYLDYASSIGAALTAGGLGIKESTELAEQAVKHFADLASFHNARVEDVAAAWQSAIRGQYEPIQRYFPFITDSYLKTYGVANGMLDENTKTLTANQRAMLLNAIALDEKLNPALNDFAETSDGLANSSRIMKAQLNDAMVMLGQNLLPIVLQVVAALNKLLTAFNNLTPFQQKMVLGFLAIVAAAGPVLSMLGTLISVLSGLAGFAGTLSGLGISFAGIGTAAAGAVPALAAVGAALLPILVVLGALILMAGLFYLAWKNNFLGVRDAGIALIKILKSLWAAFTAFLRGDTDAAFEHIQEAIDTFKAHVANAFSGFEQFSANWRNFLEAVRNGISITINFISKAFTNINWGTIGKFILLGLANGMLLGIPSLLLVAKRVAETLLAQIKRSLGIASDSKEAIKLGFFTGHGFATGVAMGANPEAIARSLVKPITNNQSSQQSITMQFANGVTVQQVRSMIAENSEQMMNTMIGALNNG